MFRTRRVSVALLAAWLIGASFSAAAALAAGKADQREIRYPSGVVESQWQVKLAEDGRELRHGRFVRFHENGRAALEAWYRDDEPVGVWHWWDTSGNTLRSVEYEYGVATPLRGDALREPTYAFTLMNGRKTAEGLLKGEKPHGRWQFWHLNGTPQAEGEYLTGIPDGRWVYFFRDGQIERDAHFQLGILHGEFRESFENGQERRRGRIDQGLKTGRWRYWYADGALRAEGNYQNDRQDGEWRFWNERGTLIRRVMFRAGEFKEELEIPASERNRELVRITTEDDLLPVPILLDEKGELIRSQDP